MEDRWVGMLVDGTWEVGRVRAGQRVHVGRWDLGSSGDLPLGRLQRAEAEAAVDRDRVDMDKGQVGGHLWRVDEEARNRDEVEVRWDEVHSQDRAWVGKASAGAEEEVGLRFCCPLILRLARPTRS